MLDVTCCEIWKQFTGDGGALFSAIHFGIFAVNPKRFESSAGRDFTFTGKDCDLYFKIDAVMGLCSMTGNHSIWCLRLPSLMAIHSENDAVHNAAHKCERRMPIRTTKFSFACRSSPTLSLSIAGEVWGYS
ncbi:hypothetical protein Y032_0167g127 [Ancylostoma ceylanicum]|uniref:Uncharacterized protein n=1 Tax=Ancylostoma ceylanicum TaxID=53326 RepID=A0A016SW95_9BILA|nr:hypothetical protein Y032_0167g127 [Ancylostoma ceylanicum]